MIARKFHPFVFAFFMAFLMSGLVSFVVTMLNIGFVANLLSIWLRAWGPAFIVAFPSVIVVVPIVRKLTEVVLEDGPADS